MRKAMAPQQPPPPPAPQPTLPQQPPIVTHHQHQIQIHKNQNEIHKNENRNLKKETPSAAAWIAAVPAAAVAAARAAAAPTLSVLSDVSLFYSRKVYKYLLGCKDHSSHFKHLMVIATSYEQWAGAGYMLDRCENKDAWKNNERSRDYDHALLHDRLEMLRSIRKAGDTATMMFTLRTSLSRNLAGMGNPKLYGYTHVGTKALIEDYIDEVTKQLNFICDVEIPGVSIASKLEFFTNIQKSFGRSALLLSGGGTFGLAHIGVIKALFEMKLLPKIITGSSGGAIIASVICTRTDDEFPILTDPRVINLDVFERHNEQGNPFLKIARLIKHGVLFDIQVFTEAMRQNLGDVTFQEAFYRTRRILNITVSSSTNYEMPRLLNYLTSPNVLIWSAVAASCSLPYVYRSAPLIAKDKSGVFVPWNPSGHLWIDGSVENDLPMQRISEMFGVNHFIVAQVNPHIIPFMSNKNSASNTVLDAVARFGALIQNESHHRLSQLIELGIFPNTLTRIKSIICQKYWGDITVVPHLPWSKYPLLLANPDVDMVKGYMNDGERGTWPKIAIMRNHCQIELCLNQNIITLREKLISGLSVHAAVAAVAASGGGEDGGVSGSGTKSGNGHLSGVYGSADDVSRGVKLLVVSSPHFRT